MPEPIQPFKLEEILKDVAHVSEPDAEFIDSLRTRFVAEGHASAQKNQELHMQKTFSKRLAWSFAVFIAVVLPLSLTRPTVVNALKRLLGYLPKVGIVDQTSQVRVLQEAQTLIRENYTVTVEQAALNSEKTIIVYSYILPPNFVMPEAIVGESTEPYLILQDGTRLDVEVAREVTNEDCPQCYARYLMEFAPISNQITEATLVIPDLVTAPSNTTPRDWRFQLKFKPADSADIVPVVEQEVTPLPTNINTNTPSVNQYGITNTLDKFIKLPDGYIIYGNTAWADARIPPNGVTSLLISIKDANDQELLFDYIDQEIPPTVDELRVYWAYKIKLHAAEFAAPLKLTFGIVASLPADGGSFTFDPGINPQLGQTWEINQTVAVNDEIIHVLSGEQVGVEQGFFLFKMQSDSNIVGASVIDLTYPPLGGGGGGGGLPEAKLPFDVAYGYQLPLPTPPYTLTFTNVEVIVPGDWVLTWSP